MPALPVLNIIGSPKMPNTAHAWPYPEFIAHRGAGRYAPENTLAAMRLGAQHGFRMMEYDVKLRRDGGPILLHDDTVQRTSCSLGKSGSASRRGRVCKYA